MDAFLRLAKGLSPSNANRDAEKVLRISDSREIALTYSLHVCPFCCDDPDHQVLFALPFLYMHTYGTFLIYCRAMIKDRERKVALTTR